VKSSAIGADDLMHATLVRRAFNRAGWVFDNKLDGFRALARRDGDRVELLSRTGRPIAINFPDVVSALRGVDGSWVLDGELVVPDERGHPSFEGIRRRGVMKLPSSIAAAVRAAPAALCVFDLLLIDGEDLRRLPLRERQARLADLVETVPGLQLVRALPDRVEALFAQVCEMDLQAIVGKDLAAAPYERGVQPTWAKGENPPYSRQEAPGFR